MTGHARVSDASERNLVVLSDGTGKKGGDGSDTNVYRLFRMLENRTSRQVVFYDPGLGTNWAKLTGNAFGLGVSKNILQCYRFLFDNYQAGDRIYLFGFSRGAFTVRSLSGFLHYFGILPKARPDLIGQAWRIYKIGNDKRRDRKAKAFTRRHHTMWVRVTLLGVWDSVGAVGAPLKGVATVIDRVPWFRHKFHNVFLSDSVDSAVHALAIDDDRKTFHPILWSEPIPSLPDRPSRHAEQVWFAGAHSDVGGGYEETELSDIVLQWMARHAIRRGLRIFSDHEVEGRPDATGQLHNPREGLGALYRKQRRTWALRKSQPLVHQSVLDRAQQLNGGYHPWILDLDGIRFTSDPSNERVFRAP